MAQEQFEELVDTFAFLEDWEDRYRHIIDLGKNLDALAPELCVPATKVEGCASQVWLHSTTKDGIFSFQGASDAILVSGLIAVLQLLYNDLPKEEAQKIDAAAELARLGLQEHLSAQRSNGVRAMITRLKSALAK